MVKILKKLTIILLSLLLIFCNSLVCFAEDGMTDEEKERIQKSQSAIDKINENKKRVQSTIKSLNALKNDTQKYIEELDKNLEALVDELNQTLENIEIKQNEINITNDELESYRQKEEKQYSDMKLRIKFFYEKGETSLLENILTGDNLEDILTKAEYIQSITNYDRKKLAVF